MIFAQIRAGGDRNFAYLIADDETRRGAVIDPSLDPAAVLAHVARQKVSVEYLINTHDHYDHNSGNPEILAKTGARLLSANQPEAGDGRSVTLGKLKLTFIHTPGHTADSICVLATEPGAPGKLITGDTLFVGKVGGTGFGDDARAEYDSLHKKLMPLPDDTEVWPGHDYGVAPNSTIGHEKRTNPFILRESFEDFVHLKRNWIQYKQEHGIT
jgi:glyoxylase-like metal-dependent hydrolase (beta-lactamase superfamily II)